MLKTTKKREVVASFIVTDEEQEYMVKNATITFSDDGSSAYNDYVSNKELYAKYRTEMRKDEAELNELRYKIEDEILADLESSKVE